VRVRCSSVSTTGRRLPEPPLLILPESARSVKRVKASVGRATKRINVERVIKAKIAA